MENIKKLEEIIKFLSENTRFLETKNFIQHGDTTVYAHVIAVAKKSIEVAEKYNLNVDMDSMIRGLSSTITSSMTGTMAKGKDAFMASPIP